MDAHLAANFISSQLVEYRFSADDHWCVFARVRIYRGYLAVSKYERLFLLIAGA